MDHSIIISLDEYNNIKAELEKLRNIDFERNISVDITIQGETYRLKAAPNEAKDTTGFTTLKNKIEYLLEKKMAKIEVYKTRLKEQEIETLNVTNKMNKYIEDADNELLKIRKEYEIRLKKYKRIETSQRYAIAVLIAICALSFFAH